jgi:CxxC motif-containing protein
MTHKEIVCIGCPLGCLVKINLEANGSISSFTGNQCQKGQEYAAAEFQHPVRVLTATVLTEGSQRRLLAVRTDKPVSKEKLKEIMRLTAHIRVKPPVKVGQKITSNIAGTGANLKSTTILHS